MVSRSGLESGHRTAKSLRTLPGTPAVGSYGMKLQAQGGRTTDEQRPSLPLSALPKAQHRGSLWRSSPSLPANGERPAPGLQRIKPLERHTPFPPDTAGITLEPAGGGGGGAWQGWHGYPRRCTR